MRALRLALAALVVAAIPLLGATPAHATITGPCKASGTVRETGKTYSASIKKVTLPLKGHVDWKGSVPAKRGKRPISGNVKVKLPFVKVTIGSWGESSDTYANSGTYTYDFPSVLGGYDIPVTGAHTEPGVVCAGVVVVHFKGGGFGNPAVIGTFVLTVISGIALIISFRPKAV